MKDVKAFAAETVEALAVKLGPILKEDRAVAEGIIGHEIAAGINESLQAERLGIIVTLARNYEPAVVFNIIEKLNWKIIS